MKNKITQWDIFISYSRQNKDDPFVELLARELEKLGYAVWYDRWILKLGDKFREKIEYGLSKSRYGIVILTNEFFNRQWPLTELDILFEREVEGHKVILPILHGVTIEDVKKELPILANRIVVSSKYGLEYVVDSVIGVLKEKSEPQMENVVQDNSGLKAFAYYGIYLGKNRWKERFFVREVGEQDALPMKYDLVQATGQVNARESYIEFMKSGWTNRPIVGLIKPNNRLRVLETKIIADHFVWINFERIE